MYYKLAIRSFQCESRYISAKELISLFMATVVRVIHTEADGRTLSRIVVLPFSVVNLEKNGFIPWHLPLIIHFFP